MFFVESPRLRRRLLRLGAVAVVCLTVAIVFVLLPNTNGKVKERFSNEPVQRVVTQRQVPVTPARRAQVNKLFDAFVPAAIARRDPSAAYDLVTPAFRAGTTRAEWRHGAVPVSFYQPRSHTFHGWTVDVSYPAFMSVQLYLQPRNPRREGAVDYSVDLKRLHGRWLIDALYQRATYAPAVAARRAKAPPTGTVPPATLLPKAKGGLMWILILAFLSLIVAVPTCFFAVQWFSARRGRALTAKREPLPPLRKPESRSEDPVAGPRR